MMYCNAFGFIPALAKRVQKVCRKVWGVVREGFTLFVLLVVLLDKPLDHAFITGRSFRITALIEEQEVLVSVNVDGCHLPSVLHSPLQCLVDRIASSKSKKAVLLLLGQCDLFLRVILQDGIQGKVKRVLSDTVILNRRVEGSPPFLE